MSKLNDLITKLCPDGVPYKKLGEVEKDGLIQLGRGNVISKKDIANNPGTYPIYSASVMNNGKFGEYGDYMFDDIRLTWSIDGGGRFFYRDDEKYSVTNVCGWLKVLDENTFNPKFLFYVLTSQWSKLVFNYTVKAHPSVIRNIYDIPMIPLPVQEEVVRILDSFTELEAELEAELADRKEQYEYYRDYLLDKNTLEKIDGTAIETKRLDEVFDTFNGMGGVSNKWDDDGNCQFIDYKNVYNNTKVDVSNTPYATVKKIPNQRAIKQGDILCTCASEVPNECALSAVVEDNIRDNIFLDDHLFGLRVKEEYADLVNTTYINYYFTTFEHRKNVFKAVHGVTRYYIDTKAFMRIPVPLPSLATQERVVDILDRFDALTTSLTDGIPAEIAMRREQYEYYRSRLLDFPRLPDSSASDGDDE